MSGDKQILVIIVASMIFCANSVILRQKREGSEAIMSLFVDKVAEGMAIIEKGAAYKGQQDHEFDFFGAKAGIDAKPKVGFGDAIRSDDDDSQLMRKKRQSEMQSMNPQQNPNDVQNIFQQMWLTIAEGAKKIVKKFGEMIENGGQQQQQQQPPSQQHTY